MSDTNFPDEQHKTAFKRLPQAQILDGGGDWEIKNLAANASWIVPYGLYEVFVCPGAAGYIYLLEGSNHRVLASCINFENGWYPASVMTYGAIVAITGEIGTPGSGDTLLAVDTAEASSFVCSMSSGWILSHDQVIHCHVAFGVRFRRVG